MAAPDYVVKVKARESKYGARVGAAWKTRVGDGINVRLDPGISVSTPEGINLTLWPSEPRDSAGFSGSKGFDGPAQENLLAKKTEGDDDMPW